MPDGNIHSYEFEDAFDKITLHEDFPKLVTETKVCQQQQQLQHTIHVISPDRNQLTMLDPAIRFC